MTMLTEPISRPSCISSQLPSCAAGNTSIVMAPSLSVETSSASCSAARCCRLSTAYA